LGRYVSTWTGVGRRGTANGEEEDEQETSQEVRYAQDARWTHDVRRRDEEAQEADGK